MLDPAGHAWAGLSTIIGAGMEKERNFWRNGFQNTLGSPSADMVIASCTGIKWARLRASNFEALVRPIPAIARSTPPT